MQVIKLRKTKGRVNKYLQFIEKHFWRNGFDEKNLILANQASDLGDKSQCVLKGNEFSNYINVLLVISI